MQRHRLSLRKSWERRVSLLFAVLFGWTFILAPAVTALAQRSEPSAQSKDAGLRHLSDLEMSHILGSHVLSISPFGGAAYGWEGTWNGINTGSGNKLTSVPIVGWRQIGGMPVNFTLNHNSEGTHDSELGQKWTHSYDIYLVMTTNNGLPPCVGSQAVHWGDDLSYVFANNNHNVFTPQRAYTTISCSTWTRRSL